MTVQELINHLSQFPKDAVCIRSFCSDYEEIDAEQITYCLAGEKLGAWGTPVVKRNGRYILYRKEQWPDNETPQFVAYVYFGGN